MKKGLFSLALGALVLAGCTSEEVVNEGVQSSAIGFEGAVVRQSRADAVSGDLTLGNLDKFMVYGFYTREDQEANPIQVFSGDAVLRGVNGQWGYNST
ncbi:MAG: hypothetical protein K2H04_03955, partial [Bacteroidaceae bacterium]|nr:hypothetical protein [Bacteroidaceae bacterium]